MNLLEKKQWLMSSLANRLRWDREGNPQYRAEQYYYDVYHAGVSPVEGKPDTWSFSIQVSDSPDGDTWWHGEFRTLNGGTDVEILKEQWSRH